MRALPVVLLVLLLCFELLAFSSSFQTYLIEKHSNADDAVSKNAQMLDFFHTGDLTLELSEAETAHMQDVKRLHDVLLVGIALLMVWVAYVLQKYKKEALLGLEKSMIVIGALGLLAAIFPSQLFYLFHLVFFPQGNFMFASTSALITIYPASYFYALAYWWLGISIGVLALLLVGKQMSLKSTFSN